MRELIAGPDLGGERSEGEPSHHAKDGAPLGVGRRIQEEAGDAPRRVRHEQFLGLNHVGDVLLQRAHGRRDQVTREPDQLGREHLLLVEPLSPTIVQPADGQPFEQERARSSRRAPRAAETIGRVVPAPRHRIDAVDPLVDVVDAIRRGVRFLSGTEGEGVLSTSVLCSRFHGFRSYIPVWFAPAITDGWAACMSMALAPPNKTVTSRCTCQETLRGPKYPSSRSIRQG